MRVLVRAGLLLARVVPPSGRGLPEIAADPHRALDDAGIASYSRVFRAPVRPAVFDAPGAVDLGRLAVEGPYSLLLAGIAMLAPPAPRPCTPPVSFAARTASRWP